MVMQMLAAGGVPVLSDGLREADEDNPRGYFEFEPAKKLLADSAAEAKGKAVKIVAPLLRAVPAGVPCRVIVIERDFDEILDSQAKMIDRRGSTAAAGDSLERRELLKTEYTRTMNRTKQWLARRANTAFLILDRDSVFAAPAAAGVRIAEFLGGGVDADAMAAVVDLSLHRNRRPESQVA